MKLQLQEIKRLIKKMTMTLIQCLSLGQFKTYLISTYTNTMATVHSKEEEVAERIEAILKSLVLHEKLNFCT